VRELLAIDTLMMEVQVYPSLCMMFVELPKPLAGHWASVDRKKDSVIRRTALPGHNDITDAAPPTVVLESIIGTPTRVEFVPIFRWQPSHSKLLPSEVDPHRCVIEHEFSVIGVKKNAPDSGTV